LALTSQGTVYGWGDDGAGELANGTFALSPYLTPIVTGYATSTALAGGENQSMTLKTDRTAWTAGDNSNGQLGNGNETKSNVPVQVSNLSAVTAISMGALGGMAVKSDGSVWGWGSNGITQSFVPVQVAGLNPIMQGGPCQ
jgi:alpha-tubulin suppressor-like RCC1 family protein